MSETRNKTKKIKNKIFAMLAAAPAMLVNPRIPAISAINKNVTVQPSIITELHCRICAKQDGNGAARNCLKINSWNRCRLQCFMQNAHKFDRAE